MGQLVSGLVWAASAVVASLGTPMAAFLVLVVGGFFIFPLTTLGLRLLGGPARLSPGNPFTGLGMQAAFVVPLLLPLVGVAAHHRENWFYPAMMLIVGAHYLPFITLYGMPLFGALAALLIGLALLLAHQPHLPLAVPAWITVAVLLAFAVLGLLQVRREEAGALPGH